MSGGKENGQDDRWYGALLASAPHAWPRRPQPIRSKGSVAICRPNCTDGSRDRRTQRVLKRHFGEAADRDGDQAWLGVHLIENGRPAFGQKR